MNNATMFDLAVLGAACAGRSRRSEAGRSVAWRAICLAGSVLIGFFAGCSLPREISKTPRSAIEQLLLTQSVERSLADLAVPLPKGEAVAVEISGLQTDRAHMHVERDDSTFGVIDAPSWDLTYVRDAAAARLGELGYLVKRNAADAAYLVRVMVEAMGTNQDRTFFGLPPIQSVIIPFALPQLTLYQELDQSAHVRLHLEVFEVGTGRFVRSTPRMWGDAYYNQYTIFFFFTFRTTDLIQPP